MERYLRERGNRGYLEKTILCYGNKICKFLQFLEDKDVTEVKRDDLEGFLDSLRNRSSSKTIKLSSIKDYLKVVSVFLSWLEDHELLPKNPARKIVREIRVEKTKRTALTLKEVRKLVKTARNLRDRAIILTMAIAGLRLSEVSNLKVDDLNIETLEIFVRQGKGRKDRIAIMDRELEEAFKVWHIYRKSMKPRTDALFTNLNGKKPLRLRHSAATFMHDSGMDILEIKEQLGHASVSTTEGYIDANETKRKQGMNRMPSLNAL